jgi:hypothetical protein
MTRSKKLQQGITTLVVAILLLLILAIVTLFTLNVGFFELRTVGNETRAKIVAQTAEAGLNYGFEIVKGNSGNLTLPSADGGWGDRWQVCASNDTTFPCGAEPDPARRGTLFRYNAAGQGGLAMIGPNGTFAPRFTQVANFDVSVRVGTLLCLLRQGTSECLSGSAVTTLVGTPDYSGLVAVTLVSEGSLSDDPSALNTQKATIASYRQFGNAPNVPVIASGSVDVAGGTADIVPNPNAGGVGVALSIWTGLEVAFASGASSGSGAVKTCHIGEFLSNAKGNSGPSEYQGVMICHDCRCDGLSLDKGLISGKHTTGGTGAERTINYDILHVYSPSGTRDDALPPNEYFPDARLTCAGPRRCDEAADPLDDNLFEFVFGIDVIDANAPGMPCVRVVDGKCPDTLYLEEQAENISCSSLNANSSGLLWSTEGVCDIPGGQVGTPRNPVFLVVDRAFKYKANTVFYGVLYKRNSTLADDVSDTQSSNPRGGGVFYGSVVIDGPINIRGNPKFVYNEAVLQNILNSPAFTSFGVVPGSWTDVQVIPE